MIVAIESLTAEGDSGTGMIGPAGPGDWGTIYWNCWFPVLVTLKVINVMVVVTGLKLCKQALVAAVAVAEAGAGTAAAGRETSPLVLGQA
jgi:hypothetical protein